MIHLGYEIGTGKAVAIPLAHMAVTGQTQQSGKTTTLEALIDRSGVRAVVFVTKPGEKSFTEGRRILPYFQERADWEYVKDLLESRTGQNIGGQIGYLMRACAGARTLQDVRNNVDSELGKRDKDLKKRKVHTSRPSVHEVLGGYIDLILHELQRVPYTDKLVLERGVNIMDLSGIDENIQDMIIRSVVDRIHQRERHTVVVVPEAWKIIPEGGRSLVFEALHRLIREGATNNNFVWIDAQDLAIVNKRILKSVSVWILGKQQEANEVVRTIRHLIAPLSIQPDVIRTLGIGEFLACCDNMTRRVYVQPRWLGELDAQAIAKREETIDTAARIFREKKRHGEIKGVKDVRREVEPIELPLPRGQVATADEIASAGEANATTSNGKGFTKPESISPDRNDVSNTSMDRSEEDETMWKEKYETLEHEVAVLARAVLDHFKNPASGNSNLPAAAEQLLAIVSYPGSLSQLGKRLRSEGVIASSEPSGGSPITDLDAIYEHIRKRAIEKPDPYVLLLLTSRPELRIRIEPKVLELDEDSARGQVAKLIHEGFFAEPRNGNAACSEILDKRRFKGARVSVYRALDDIAGMGFLVKDKSGFVATGLKVTVTK